LAGVIAVPRRILVLDEPTAMLDPAGRDEVLAAVRELRGDGLAIVYITQEMDETVGADRVVALERGTEAYAGDACGLFADTALVRRLGLGLPAAGELALALAEQGRASPACRLPWTSCSTRWAARRERPRSGRRRSACQASRAGRAGLGRHESRLRGRVVQLRGGESPDPRVVRRVVRAAGRRLSGADGRVGLRQIDAAPGDPRPGRAGERRRAARRRRSRGRWLRRAAARGRSGLPGARAAAVRLHGAGRRGVRAAAVGVAGEHR